MPESRRGGRNVMSLDSKSLKSLVNDGLHASAICQHDGKLRAVLEEALWQLCDGVAACKTAWYVNGADFNRYVAYRA